MSKSRKNNGKNNNIVPRSQHGTAGSNMVWTKEAVSEADFMVFRDAATNKIVNVVAPNGLQVGLFDPAFPGNLTATGHITGSGEIYAHHNITAKLGFTGSLQKLYDGTDYLLGGSNVTVTNNVNGSITIAANTAATTGEVLTAGSGLDMAGTFDGSTARTINLDIDSESSVTAASGDFVLIHDITDGTIKKTTVGSIQGAGATIDISGLSNSLNETQLAIGDLFAVADVDAANETKKITVQDFSQFLASETNGGISESGGKLAISLSELSTVSVDVSADSIAILDATDASTKLESIPDLVSGMAGTVTNTAIAASSGVLSVDITNQVSIASLAAGDEVLVYDVDTSALKKATVSDFSIGSAPVDAQYVVLSSDSTLTNESVLSAGDGLDLSSSTFSLDLKSSGGLKIDSTELSIEPTDFAGAGLEDDGSDNLRISAAAAGTGLSGGGGSALSVDYGSTSGKAVEGNTSFALTAGYGMSGGISSTAIGGGISLNLDVEPEEFAGTGLSTSSNNLNVYLSAGAGTEITTGSEGNLVITPHVKEYHFSSSAVGMLSTTGSLSLAGNLGYNHKTSDVGLDVFTFISGSKSSRGTSERGTTAFGGDVVISGTLYGGSPLNVGTEAIFPKGISGSLTQLSDGSSYLVAGNNITIATGSNGSITITSSGGGEGGGSSGAIGAAEDGTYEDGLFTDFTTTTPVGTAVDRFNELFKSLVPKTAPSLSTIDLDTASGVAGLISFGSSNTISGIANVVALEDLPVIDVNGSYIVETSSGGHVRSGIYAEAIELIGDLAAAVTIDLTGNSSTNYPAKSFGKANLGTLVLEINGSNVKTVDLTSESVGAGAAGSGTGSELTNGTGFFELSAATSGRYNSGDVYDLEKHRTGKWKIAAAAQRAGWNYMRVKHVIGSTTYTTTYIQWVVDSVATNGQINLGTPALSSLALTGSKHLSGVEYYTGGTATYAVSVGNFYTNVYAASNITIDSSEIAPVVVTPSSINTGGGEDESKAIAISETVTIDATTILNSPLSVSISATHPTKNSISSQGAASLANLLVYNIAEASTTTLKTVENMDGESYRLENGTYTTQSDVSSGAFDSTVSLVTNSGLQVWNRRLVAPIQSTNGGDYSAISRAPSGNPDYSGLTTGTKTYFRKFTNTKGGSSSNFTLEIDGSGTIVDNTTSLTGDKLQIFMKVPGSGTNVTGWMDLSSSFVTGAYADNDGCYVETFDSSLNSSILFTSGIKYIENNGHIVIKIVADGSWTGHVDELRFTWR